MQKAHSNIDWENKPSDKTPINEQNLNKMDRSIDAIDDRVITLDTTKFDKTDAQGLFKDVSLNSENGVITFTLYNGATKTIDTLLEKIAVNFDYNPTMQQLIITLDDGEIKYIDMSALVTQYEFLDSDTIAFTANASGKISAIVKEGSIEEKHLRPDYLADVKTEVSKAQASAQSAAQSADDADYDAKLAQSYAVGGTGTREGEDADNAKYYSEKSQEALQKLQETTVTSIKGNAESAYRTGDVNLTPENVGALSLKGGTVSGKVTINNSFIVNKTSTTSPTGIIELDIHNDGKVAINTTANGGAGNSLIHFEGSVGGTITNRANYINSYVRTIQQQQYDLNIFSGNAINFKAKDFKVEDYRGNGGLKIDGGDVYIGDVSSVEPNYLDSDNGRTRLCIQSHPDLQSRTNLFTDSFYAGRQGDWFLECSRYNGWKKVKIRYGKNGSNIDCGNGWFSMWANDNGIQIYNTNSAMGDIHLSRNDGTSLFCTDIILQGNTEHKADLYLETGNIFGQRSDLYRYNHAIKLGHANDDVMRFYEVGGLWEFSAGTGTGAFSIEHDWEESWILQSGYARIIFNSDNDINLNPNGFTYIYGENKTICCICPDGILTMADSVYDLGSSWAKWRNVYATNGTIQTSDRNKKNAIEELSSEKAQSLIYGLKPSTYQMNTGTSGRTHWGMISQDIEELFDEIGMTSLDFAGFIKSPKMTEEVRDEETGKIIKESEVVEGEYDYSLRYDEFIAPIIKVIQSQHEEIEALKQRIELLEQQVLQQ